ELSPLLMAELPDWMLLHFQTDEEHGWGSPQIPSDSLKKRLAKADRRALRNVTPTRAHLLDELIAHLPAPAVLAATERRGLQLTTREMALMPGSKLPDNTTFNQPQGQGFQQPAPQQGRGQDGGTYGEQEYLSRAGQQSRIVNDVKIPQSWVDRDT